MKPKLNKQQYWLVMGRMNLGGDADSWKPLRLSSPKNRQYDPKGELVFTEPAALFSSRRDAKRAIERTRRGWTRNLFVFYIVRCEYRESKEQQK